MSTVGDKEIQTKWEVVFLCDVLQPSLTGHLINVVTTDKRAGEAGGIGACLSAQVEKS